MQNNNKFVLKANCTMDYKCGRKLWNIEHVLIPHKTVFGTEKTGSVSKSCRLLFSSSWHKEDCKDAAIGAEYEGTFDCTRTFKQFFTSEIWMVQDQ